MTSQSLGQFLIVIGVAFVLLGGLLWLGGLSWFGHLPGDIRIERASLRVYVPITSMLVISVALSIGLYLLRRFF